MLTHALRPAPLAKPAAPFSGAPPRRAPELRSILLNAGAQPKLRLGAANDPAEAEADRTADRIMRMDEPHPVSDARRNILRRKCAECDEEDKVRRKETPGQPAALSTGAESAARALGPGAPLPASERAFFEPRFGRPLADVRIHDGAEAAKASSAIHARAFALGSSIAFARGEYRPGTYGGRQLMAHELAHVGQSSAAAPFVRRKTATGRDNGGTYAFDDEDCAFKYKQKWFFKFDPSVPAADRPGLMADAETHVHDAWSDRFKLIPQPWGKFIACACKQGVSVDVGIEAQEGSKEGVGIAVTVKPSVRASVNHVTGNTEFEHNPTTSDFRGTQYKTGLQYTVAHEFGHTIDLTDDYSSFGGFFAPSMLTDLKSQMNEGNSVRLRHYQYFGDLLSLAKFGCRYSPDGIRQPDRERSVLSSETMSGIPVWQDGMKFKDAEKTDPMGRFYDMRVSNTRVLGIFYPELGAVRFSKTSPGGGDEYGLTAGLRLSQFAYPFRLNLRTGIALNPLDPAHQVKVPVSLQVGLRTDKFEFGMHLTPLINVSDLGGSQFMTGLGFRMKLH
jgi:Domain of unknown function (DUF4157)